MQIPDSQIKNATSLSHLLKIYPQSMSTTKCPSLKLVNFQCQKPVLTFLVNCLQKFLDLNCGQCCFIVLLYFGDMSIWRLSFYDIIHNEVVDVFIVLAFVFVSSLAHHSTHQIRPSITFLFRPGCDAEARVDL